MEKSRYETVYAIQERFNEHAEQLQHAQYWQSFDQLSDDTRVICAAILTLAQIIYETRE